MPILAPHGAGALVFSKGKGEMQRIVRLVSSITLVLLVLAACTTPDTTAPTVTIVTPTDGATVAAGTSVEVSGKATDAGGIANVAVLVDGTEVVKVVPGATGTWTFPWTPTTEGTYELSAKATDKAGNSATSLAVTVTVTPALGATGSISGIITRTPPAGPAGLSAAAAPAPAPIVPGDAFVVFKPGARDVTLGTTAAGPAGALSFTADGGFAFAGNGFAKVTSFAHTGGLALYRSSGLDEAATRALVDDLRASDLVAEAFPNWILSANATPNDPLYGQQWHYAQLNLPAAWDVETGATNKVTVAVLDTGRFGHTDVQWAVGGANFANWNGTTPGAGEGSIDDPRTNPGGSTHGTHVAGTIGAITNNGAGVAGVNWNVDVLPVKVLGADGSGNFAGILEGIAWAAGETKTAYGTHINDNPAAVINMSLGGLLFDACPASIDGYFETLAGQRTYIVVSAGNDGSPADIAFPANCPHAITVGATGPTGARAYYSNYGPFIDVMAPGGDFDYGSSFGVLSTYWNGTSTYGYMEGTSMAAPHVSGVVSLMLAHDPDLTFDEVVEGLHNASAPLTQAECNVPALGFDGLNLCGAGLLDAEAAVLGNTLTTPTAYAYALPYEGGVAPWIGYGDLGSLEALAPYKVEATALAGGDFSYSLAGLEPGTYEVIGLELRDAATGISTIDRYGVVTGVEVVADEDADATVVVVPMYTMLPVAD